MANSEAIRRMRKARGLKGFQLADRLQVSAARVSVLEKDEQRGAVTLKMMNRVAAALGCRFEYRFIPLGQEARDNEPAVKPRYRAVVDRAVESEK